jgi:hypothetical protein
MSFLLLKSATNRAACRFATLKAAFRATIESALIEVDAAISSLQLAGYIEA